MSFISCAARFPWGLPSSAARSKQTGLNKISLHRPPLCRWNHRNLISNHRGEKTAPFNQPVRWNPSVWKHDLALGKSDRFKTDISDILTSEVVIFSGFRPNKENCSISEKLSVSTASTASSKTLIFKPNLAPFLFACHIYIWSSAELSVSKRSWLTPQMTQSISMDLLVQLWPEPIRINPPCPRRALTIP